MTQRLAGLGIILILVSLATNLYIWGAESQARALQAVILQRNEQLPIEQRFREVFGDEAADGLKQENPKTFAVLDSAGEEKRPVKTLKDVVSWAGPEQLDFPSTTGALDKYQLMLVLSDPPFAMVEWGDPEKRESNRTPTLVPNDKTTYRLSTRFRAGTFERDVLTKGVAKLSLLPLYAALSYAFIPGLLLLGAAWKVSRKPSAGRPSTIKDRSSSLDTVLRTAPPLAPDGLFKHDSGTRPEDQFGRFVRGELIGKGAMGEVYKCTSCLPGDQNTYALKVLLPEWSKATDFRTRFEREADICRKLDHPNLVRAYDHGEKDGRLWMVMDYVDGEELESWLKSGDHSEEELVKLFRQVCQGLEYAHKVGVIHRDLKPGNILVRRHNQQPVIADFGLARGKHYATITKTNTTLGTPTYMAPEQVTGGKGSPESDLYSLGCVMYEALAGKPPFEETDVMALLMLKLQGETPPELPAGKANDKLRATVMKLLSNSPEQRFRSAGELMEALKD